MSDYDFYGGIDSLVDGLDLPQDCFEAGCRVCDGLRGEDNFLNCFAPLGGRDAVVAASVFLGARCEGCPVSAERVVEEVVLCPGLELASGVDGGDLRRVAFRFKNVSVSASDYIGFYGDVFDFPVDKSDLKRVLGVSDRAVGYRYRELVEELTGVDDVDFSRLNEVDLTVESFGFHGDDVLEFADYLVEEVEVGGTPKVLAAAALYVAGHVVEG